VRPGIECDEHRAAISIGDLDIERDRHRAAISIAN